MKHEKWMWISVAAIIITSMIVNRPAQASDWTCNLTERQQEVVQIAYQTGKPYNLSYTMIAIAMRESRLGVWNIALGENSFGPWHVRVNHVLIDQNWNNTRFNRNRAAQALLDDDWYAAQMALGVLRWWINYHKEWAKGTESYNAGHGSNPSYLAAIRDNIRHIQKCNWTEDLEERVHAAR